MQRTRSVTPQWRDGMWKVRVTDPNPDASPKRPWVPLEGIPISDPELAQRKAAVIVEIVRANGLVAMTGEETVSDWMGRWFTARERRLGVGRVKTERGQWTLHFADAIGHLPLAAVSAEHGRAIVTKLDAAVEAGDIAWKTASNLWAIVSKAMKDAAGSKDNALRVLEANPFAGVKGPDKGQRKQKQYLYPEELLALVSCADVPLWRRRLYAFAVYSYMRAGEIAPLRWTDVDAKRGHVTVHTSVARFGSRKDADTRRAEGGDGTKTEVARRYVLEAPVLELLAAMFAEADDRQGLVFLRLPPYHGRDGQAPTLRADLLKAGVDRPALHATTKTQKQITFHDLRATAITWAAIRGDSPLKIQARSGHETLDVLMAYVREAEAVRDGFGEPFPALPAAALGVPEHRPAIVPNVPKMPRKAEKMATPTGIETLSENRVPPRNDVENVPIEAPASSRAGEPRSPEADLAEALRLAAAASQWDVVAMLSRQLAAMQAAAGEGASLRVVKGGSRGA